MYLLFQGKISALNYKIFRDDTPEHPFKREGRRGRRGAKRIWGGYVMAVGEVDGPVAKLMC